MTSEEGLQKIGYKKIRSQGQVPKKTETPKLGLLKTRT